MLNKVILIVDDDKDFRELVASSLKENNYSVFEACNGHGAIEIIQCIHVDIVLTELLMRESKSVELCTKIKAIDSDINIVAMTAGGWANTPQEMRETTRPFFDSFLSKPFKLGKLINAFDKFPQCNTKVISA